MFGDSAGGASGAMTQRWEGQRERLLAQGRAALTLAGSNVDGRKT